MAAAHVSEAIAGLLKTMILSNGKVNVCNFPEEARSILFKSPPLSVQMQKTDLDLSKQLWRKFISNNTHFFGRTNLCLTGCTWHGISFGKRIFWATCHTFLESRYFKETVEEKMKIVSFFYKKLLDLEDWLFSATFVVSFLKFFIGDLVNNQT